MGVGARVRLRRRGEGEGGVHTSRGCGSAGSVGAKVARRIGSNSANTALSSIRSIVVEKGGAHLAEGVWRDEEARRAKGVHHSRRCRQRARGVWYRQRARDVWYRQRARGV